MSKKNKRKIEYNSDKEAAKKTKNVFNYGFVLFAIGILLAILINNKYLQYINKFVFFIFSAASITYLFLIYKEKYDIKKLLIIGLLLIIFVKLLTFYAPIEINGDNADYLTRGKAIIMTGLPRKLYEPGAPIETSLYNIGIVFIFSLLYKITGGILIPFLFKMVFVIFSIFIFLLLYMLFSLYLDKYTSLAFSFIISLHQQIIHFSSLLLTEIPFLFFALLTIFISSREIYRKKRFLIWISAGISLFYTTMVRNAGLLFLGLLPLSFFIKGKKMWEKATVIFMTGVVLFSIWIYGKNLMKQYAQKNKIIITENIADKKGNFITNTLRDIYNFRYTYITNLFKSVWIVGQKLIGNPDNVGHSNIWAIIVGLVILLGLIFDIYKKKYLFASFFLSIFVAIVIRFGGRLENVVMSRYYFAVIPFAYYYFYVGLKESLMFLKNKEILKIQEKRVVFITVISFLVFYIINMRNLPKEILIAKQGYPPVIQNFANVGYWIKNNIKDDIIVGNRKPSVFYLYSDKKSTIYYKNIPGKFDRQSPWSQELENETLKMYKEINIDYIVLDSFSSDPYVKLLPIIQHHPDLFEVYYFPKQFNIPEGYVKTIPQLFMFVNNYYRKTKRVFVPTVLLKINKKRLDKIVVNLQ